MILLILELQKVLYRQKLILKGAPGAPKIKILPLNFRLVRGLVPCPQNFGAH